jgi:hypothetical protein
MVYEIEMAPCCMRYVPSFMKIGVGLQVILRFGHSNLKICNVGITEGKEFISSPLRWIHTA